MSGSPANGQEAGRAWLRGQLLSHCEDMDGGTASDLAEYMFDMTIADAKEYMVELLPRTGRGQIEKICAELGRRRGVSSARVHAPRVVAPAAPTAKSKIAPFHPGELSEGPRKKGKRQNKKGTLILSNASHRSSRPSRQDSSSSPSPAPSKAQNIAAQLNPFLAGAPPAEFVANCLCCGAIVWYNEPSEKICNSGRSEFCHNLLLDACDPETGTPDPDYALTKKARKKKRRAREQREAMESMVDNPEVISRDGTVDRLASASLAAARKRTARLVGFDKQRTARSEVYDDQSDYFTDASSSWLSPEERKAAQKLGEAKRKEAQDRRREVRVQFDFAGRRVVEVNGSDDDDDGDGNSGGSQEEVKKQGWLSEYATGADSSNSATSKGPQVVVPNMDSSEDFPVSSMPKNNALYGRAASIYADLVERMRTRETDDAVDKNDDNKVE